MVTSSSNTRDKLFFALTIFFITSGVLSLVYFKVDSHFILAERFIKGSGIIEIILLGLYSFLVALKMHSPQHIPKWRNLTWNIFMVIFFSQLILGISGIEKCLMSGNLHLPVPAIILGGAIFKGQISFMVILFISTVFLSGPSWCSHLCYFGSIDNMITKLNKDQKRNGLEKKHFWMFKLCILGIFIAATIILRLFSVSINTAALFGGIFGIIGFAIMFLYSIQRKTMIHCTVYCPIGTIISILKYISPFRMTIENTCTNCMNCLSSCKYNALTEEGIESNKIGLSCTYCGDCITTCKHHSLRYRLLSLSARKSHLIYLGITISLHAIFIGLARL